MTSHDHEGKIAVIGLGCRFPDAPDYHQFWNNLISGKECISRFTREELLASGITTSDLDHPNYVPAAPVIADADCFDASFFGINPHDARQMDPQHRLFLECCWNTLEDGGCNPDAFEGKIGVFAGSSVNFYLLNHIIRQTSFTDPSRILSTIIGNEKDYLATRISYSLNLTGPSINVQSACSTSLVAVHLATQSLLNYECDMALSGGVTLRIPQKQGYMYQDGLIYSKDGHCRAFDHLASGTVFGEGVGAVLLRRLEDAIEDNDRIDAVLLASAINNDGSQKVGFTAPSVQGQRDVIESAQAIAEIEPEQVGYIEAHGTGTTLGDPIEIEALSQVFGTSSAKTCVVGSVKSGIGHLDAAAGVAGLIKTVLTLKNGKIPPTLHFTEPNPHLHLEKTPFFITSETIDIQNPPEELTLPKPFIAGVSSFGVGGTNAHIVLEAAPQYPKKAQPQKPGYLLPLSAKTAESLHSQRKRLSDFLTVNPETHLADCAFTLQTGRKHFPVRETLYAESREDLLEILHAPFSSDTASQTGEKVKTVFMFSGQGTQYPGMTRMLYDNIPQYAGTINSCLDVVRPLLEKDLSSLLFSSESDYTDAATTLAQTSYTQPALFIIEYSLARLITEFGISPDILIGHSIGEYVAATIAGVFTPEQALAIVCMRGKLMHAMEPGAMLSVAASSDSIAPLCCNGVSVSVVNAPEYCVVGGTHHAISEFSNTLRQKGIKHSELHTSHAFHSPMMNDAADKFTDYMASQPLSPPGKPFISNVTGTWITEEDAVSPEYWGRHLKEPVQFSRGITTLSAENNSALIEVGPGNTLCTLARLNQSTSPSPLTVLPMLPGAARIEDTYRVFFKSLAALCDHSVGTLDWNCIAGYNGGKRIALPGYAFDKHRYWIDSATNQSDLQQRTHDGHAQQQQQKEVHTSKKDALSALRTIWQKLLGYDTIADSDNFYTLGGTSLMAAELFASIEKELGITLPLSSLISAPTIGELAKLIDTGSSTKELWNNIVPIRKTGSRKPLFLIHGGSGNILLYRELAASLENDIPVYGIQATGLDGKEPPLTSIEEMASRYIKQILEVDPEGPYFLGGYCMGGTIVYEMACQLQRQNKRVELAALFDTYREWPKVSPMRKFTYFFQNIGFHLNNIRQASLHGKYEFIRERSAEALRRLFRKVSIGKSKISARFKLQNNPVLLSMEKINDTAASNYTPNAFPGTVTLFIPRQTKEPADPYLGWKTVCGDKVKLVRLNAYRNGILVRPFVQEIADILQTNSYQS